MCVYVCKRGKWYVSFSFDLVFHEVQMLFCTLGVSRISYNFCRIMVFHGILYTGLWNSYNRKHNSKDRSFCSDTFLFLYHRIIKKSICKLLEHSHKFNLLHI